MQLMDRERIASFCREHGIVPVEVCGVDNFGGGLTGCDGRVYYETCTNCWACVPEERNVVVYLHANLHHGGILLRPMFVKIDGAWYSVFNGKPAPEGMPYPAHQDG